MPKTSASRASTRRPRASLSRDVIVAAAEAVAARDGLDGLTFQALGEELGAHPTSIYRHFRDKDELVLELIDTLRQRSFGGMLHVTDDWREDLRSVARAIHEHYQRHPELALQMAARTTRRPTEFANVDFALGALLRAGLSEEDAVVCLRVFGNFVRSISAIEAAIQALPPAVRVSDEMAWAVEYRQASSKQHPHIAQLSDRLISLGNPMIFDEGLEMMLDAIAVRADRG